MQRITLQQKRMGRQSVNNSHITKLTALGVEMSIDDTVVAKAVRADTQSSWHIGTLVMLPGRSDRVMMNAVVIERTAQLSERRQRKLVIAIVKSLADSL